MKRKNRWHLMDGTDVLKAFSTDMNSGLSAAEAKKRTRFVTPLWYVRRRSTLGIVAETFADLSTVLMIVAAAAAAFSDKNVQAGIIAGILIVGAAVRAVSAIAAHRILENAAESRIPHTNVLRDGVIRPLSANRIVPGDIIILGAGDTVPCDARVLSDYESTVSEKSITDNSEPVHKFNSVISPGAVGADGEEADVPCEFRSNTVFAGSLVLSGSICAVATSCGKSSLVGRKLGGVGIVPDEESDITAKMRQYGRISGIAMVAAVLLIVTVSMFSGKYTLADVFLPALALICASISEFIPTVGLFITSVVIMNCRHVERKSSEDGGCASAVRNPKDTGKAAGNGCAILCGTRLFKSGKSELYAFRVNGVLHRTSGTDKYAEEAEEEKHTVEEGSFEDSVNGFDIGKLTEHTLDETDASASADGKAAEHDAPDESPKTASKNAAQDSPTELLSLAYSAACGNISRYPAEMNSARNNGNRTDVVRVVTSAAEAFGIDKLSPPEVLDHVNSSAVSAFRMEISMVRRGDEPYIVACGRIADVMKCCSRELADGEELPIDSKRKENIFVTCATVEYEGAAVVAVAIRKSPYNMLTRLSGLINDMTFVGFIASSEEPLAGVVDDILRMKSCGRYPVLFSDYPLNDLYYCRRLGLFGKETKTVACTDISVTDIEEARDNGLIVSLEDTDGFNRADMLASAAERIRETVHSGESGARGDNIVSLVSDVRDCEISAHADCAFTVSPNGLRSPADSVIKKSFAIVQSGGEKGSECGGFTGFVRTLNACRRAKTGAKASMIYLGVSGGVRIAAVLLALFVPAVPMLSPAAILIWGELVDLAVVAGIVGISAGGR